MTKTVRAVIFDPCNAEGKFLREEEISTGLETLQGLVGGMIEGVYPAYVAPEFEGVHAYVNEEFLYTHPEWRERPWALPGYDYLCGPAVFLGSTEDGNEADCPLSAVQILPHIKLSAQAALLISEQAKLAQQAG